MDMSRYRSLFISEAREYVASIHDTLIALENSPADRAAVDLLFRAAHSIKGMAASMDLADLVELAHHLEDLMIRVRDQGLRLDAGVAELLGEGAELVEELLDDVEKEAQPRRSLGDLPARLASYPAAGAGGRERRGTEPGAQAEAAAPREESPAPAAPIPAAPLPGEAPPAGRERGREPGEVSSVRVKTEVLDLLVNLTGELVTNKNRLLNLAGELGSSRLNEKLSETNRLLRALQNEVMKVRLIPFEAVSDRFGRVVRELARKSGKKLQFQLEGQEIGLDRGILEQLVDPLNHILRNAVDHGLERSEERLAAGKPAQGLIRLSVSRDRDRVMVTVTDDGRGMEPERLAAAAVEKGLIGAGEAELLTPRQALMLCCLPGFSTAGEVTELSGRGVGMDAVSATIAKLGGMLFIDSQPGRGSSFTLRLPMTIAIIHALIVQCGQVKVAIPVSAVHRNLELKREELEKMGRRRVFRLDGETVPLLSLNRLLGLPLNRLRGPFLPVFVTEAKGRRLGIAVDRMLGQQELFVKPLGRPLAGLPGVEGGATLSDGEIVTVVNIAEIV